MLWFINVHMVLLEATAVEGIVSNILGPESFYCEELEPERHCFDFSVQGR